jgi:hypothetical protein
LGNHGWEIKKRWGAEDFNPFSAPYFWCQSGVTNPRVNTTGLAISNLNVMLHRSRLISESQERSLSLPEKMSLKMHLMMCSGCTNFKQQVPFLSQAMKAYAQGADEVQGTPEGKG